MVSNQYWDGRVYDMCMYFMTGAPEGSTESGFIETFQLGIMAKDTLHHYTKCSVINIYEDIINLSTWNLYFFQSSLMVDL